MRDILFIDAEAGDTTVLTEPDKEYYDAARKYVDVVRVTTFKELSRVQEYLKAHCTLRDAGNDEKLKELEKKLRPSDFNPDTPPRKYNTVILDSLSEAEIFSMYQLLGITERTRLDEEMAESGWPEFRKNHSQILRMIRAFRDLPMHVLMTSAADYSQNEAKLFVYKPQLTGKLAKQCQGFMDVVGFMAVVAGEEGKPLRRMFVQPNARWNAKCRFASYKEPHYDDPDLKKILASVGLLERK